MKKLLLFAFTLIITGAAFGQPPLTGVFTIPGSFPGGYSTIGDAISDLNARGVGAGGVTFDITPGYTEPVTSPLLVTATGTPGNQIIFQKNPSLSGPDPLVARTDAGTIATSVYGGQGDAVIIIQGSDYLTFNALDVTAGSQGIEYGYYLRKASGSDGCKFVTIKNAAITMNKGTSAYVAGIYSSNNDATSSPGSSAGIGVTSIGGRNESISVTGNTISNVFAGILFRGYNHSFPPYDLQDQNNVAGAAGAGNIIRNYAGNAASTSYGVYLIWQTSPNVSFNTIDNAGDGGTDATGPLYGICMSSSNAGGNMVFSNNNIKLSQGSTSLANCINIVPAGISAVVNSNTFSYGAFKSEITSFLIFCSNATPNITIDGNQTTGLINKTGAGELNCFFNSGASSGGMVSITGNTFSNITLTVASAFYGIRQASSVSEVEVISNNFISGIAGGSSAMYGIFQGFGAAGSMVSGNVISNWTGSGPMVGLTLGVSDDPVSLTASDNEINSLHTTGVSVVGIRNLSGIKNSIYGNKVCDLLSGNENGFVYGIYLVGGATTNVYNNYLTGLQCPNASAPIPLAGIYVAGGTSANVFYNTVCLYAMSSGATFGSAALYASTAPNLDMRNNILVNKSIPKGAAGYTAAYRRTSTDLSTYSINSNANDFYAGTPGPKNLIFYDGTNADQAMATYQTRVGPARDNISFSEDPPFEGTPFVCNPHIKTTVPTLCESGGIQVTSPFPVTDDIDGDPRSSIPDVGADEFNGISPFSCFPPTGIAIAFTSPTSVIISWLPAIPVPGVGYDYEVRTSGVPGSGPEGLFISGSTPGLNISVAGLAAVTTYYVYLRSDCGNGKFSSWSIPYPFTTPRIPIITGTVSTPGGIPPAPGDLFILASLHCNPSITQTTENGVVEYEVIGGVGTYRIYDFPGNPVQPGDMVDVTFYDGVHFRPIEVTIPGSLTVVADVQIVINMSITFQKTDWFTIAIPPDRTLLVHWNGVQWPYDGTGGCGNTDVQQWNGNSWYLPSYSPWNFNPDSTVRQITNNTGSYIFKRFHCDDGYGFTLDFTIVPSTGQTSPANPQDFALLNVGGRDGFSCEFGDIISPVHTFIYQYGAMLQNFPSRLGADGVQDLEIQFDSYNNIFWGDMELRIDLVDVTQPGTLELLIPDAVVPIITVAINPGDTVCYFHPGGILIPGNHKMDLLAQGGLSMGVDCFNFTSRVAVPVLPTVTTAPVSNITPVSAESGGNVTSDGGATVMARGVCWSILPNPTILDNITLDGAGIGPYTSIMTPLLPSTIYHVRAYATNNTGTGYGDDLSFTTLTLVPEFRIVQKVTVDPLQSVCYDATNTITVAGDETYFVVEPSGSAIFAAGSKIIILPDTWIKQSGYMHAYVDSTGEYCGAVKQPDATVMKAEEKSIRIENFFFRIYPNPTTGNFTLEQKGDKSYTALKIEIYGMRGEKVMTAAMTGEKKHEFQFSNVPAGLYFVKVLTDDSVETIKLVKAR